MSTVIRIPDDLYRRLEKMAVGFDTPANVIEKLLNQKEKNMSSISPDSSASEFKKMHLIEKWAKSPQQGNSQIIQAYLDMSNENVGINIDSFIEELKNRKIYEGKIDNIKSNLSQMKNDDQKQHGRIFYENNDKVIIYDAVYEEILKHFDN